MNLTLLFYVIGAFLFGWGCARVYYTFFTKDWGSWDWSTNKWWIKYHKLACYLCPRKHYCKKYIERR